MNLVTHNFNEAAESGQVATTITLFLADGPTITAQKLEGLLKELSGPETQITIGKGGLQIHYLVSVKTPQAAQKAACEFARKVESLLGLPAKANIRYQRAERLTHRRRR